MLVDTQEFDKHILALHSASTYTALRTDVVCEITAEHRGDGKRVWVVRAYQVIRRTQ